MATKTIHKEKEITLHLKDRDYSVKKCCMVMGIVNATSDSFYENSRISSLQEGIERSLEMIEQGADILDLGAESSRPGAEYVDAETELSRLFPLVEGIRKYNKTVPISIDTRKKCVIEECVKAGADILNDISALEDDEQIASFAAKSKIPVILMHKRGNPSQMQKNTSYDDVVREVSDYLYERADYAIGQGISRNKIIFDVGIGFGKDLKSNLQLVRNCGKISRGYDSHSAANGDGDEKILTLMALSRKTMIQAITGKKSQDCLYGTIVANAFSILAGSDIVRVHDVEAAVDMVNILTELIGDGDE